MNTNYPLNAEYPDISSIEVEDTGWSDPDELRRDKARRMMREEASVALKHVEETLEAFHRREHKSESVESVERRLEFMRAIELLRDEIGFEE